MAQSHNESDEMRCLYYYDYCYSRQPIPSTILLDAFVDLKSFIGMAAVWELIKVLKTNGISLEIKQKSYSLFQLEQELVKIFAESGTSLLMEKLVRLITASQTAQRAAV
jgi:hypothetical protein